LGAGSTKIVNSDGPHALARPRSPDVARKLRREAVWLRKFRGARHLLSSIAAEQMRDELRLPRARHGSLLDLLDSLEFDGQRLGAAHVDEIIKQVNLGLDELQALGLRHGDLRLANVLVFAYDANDVGATHIKLCDFEDVRTGPRDDVDAFVAQFLKLI
jgi:hypothetical protein